MRYVVIGAGAIGGTLGGRLSQAGRAVVLVARGAHLAALRDEGLRLVDPDRTSQIVVPAVDGPAALELRRDDVLVLAVKSQDTSAVLDAWAGAPVAGGGTAGERLPIVCAQNGVANERLALRRFAHTYAACVWLPAVHLEPGVVAVRSAPVPGVLELGRYPHGIDDLVVQVAADLRAAGFSARVSADVMRWKYVKLLRNLGNAIDAAVVPGPAAERLRRCAVEEARKVFAVAGVAVASDREEATRRKDIAIERPVLKVEETGSSTWQSLARGARSIETDYLNGEIVLLGRLHGVTTPINRALQRVANAVARDGTPPRTTPAEEILSLARRRARVPSRFSVRRAHAGGG